MAPGRGPSGLDVDEPRRGRMHGAFEGSRRKPHLFGAQDGHRRLRLRERRLDVQRAIISTEAYGIVDVFYVTDRTDEKVTEEDRIQEIRRRLTSDIEAFLMAGSN